MKIVFANFGTPALDRNCSAARAGHCPGAPNTQAVVESLCLGKTICSIAPRVQQFGPDPCPDVRKSLVVLATGCTTVAPASPLSSLDHFLCVGGRRWFLNASFRERRARNLVGGQKHKSKAPLVSYY